MLHGLLRLFLVLLTICYSLARRKTSAELLDAQQRGAPFGAHKLEVRTDFRSDIADHLVSEWTLRNACVTFHNWRGTLHRAQFVSLENISAVIHSFSEYSFGFGRLAFVRPAESTDAPALAQCEKRSLGLALTVSSNNLYHQFFHAVPAFEALLRYVQPDAVFVPLVSYMATSWLHPATNYSHAWEFSLRALSSAPAKQLMEDTLRLFDAPCTCFERVEGATGAVSLFYPKARPRILAFCRQAVKMARSMPPRPVADGGARFPWWTVNVLYVRRGGIKRALANDAEVSRAYALAVRRTDPHAEWVADASRWKGSPSLAYVPRIRSVCWRSWSGDGVDALYAGRSTACRRRGDQDAELAVKRSVSDRNMYGAIASALGIYHTPLTGELAAGCNTNKDVLGCNVTVAVPTLLQALSSSAVHVSASPSRRHR